MSSSICPDCLLQVCPGLNLYGLFKWQLCCFCTRLGAGESLVRSDPQCLGAGLQRRTTGPTSPSLGGLPTCLGCCEEAGLFQTHRPLCLPQFRRTFPLCLSKAFPSLSLAQCLGHLASCQVSFRFWEIQSQKRKGLGGDMCYCLV